MGYNTTISGKAVFDEKVSVEVIDYINRFNKTRHVLRDVSKIKELDKDWQKRTPFMEMDDDAVYYAPGNEEYARGSIINNNEYPKSIPDYYCPWKLDISKENERQIKKGEICEAEAILIPDGCDKPYGYTEYLQYIIDNFFEPMKYALHGAFLAIGEEFGDAEYLVVSGGVVKAINAYENSANAKVKAYLANSAKDKKAMDVFNSISVAPWYLEGYWEEDD